MNQIKNRKCENEKAAEENDRRVYHANPGFANDEGNSFWNAASVLFNILTVAGEEVHGAVGCNAKCNAALISQSKNQPFASW